MHLPPLRERPDDILAARRALREQLGRRGGTTAELPERTIAAFVGQAWPGNVRELRNAVARALSLGISPQVAPAAEPKNPGALPVDLSVPLKIARDRIDEAFERDYVTQALQETGGNVSRAAEIAGVNRKFIQRAIKRYGLRGAKPDP